MKRELEDIKERLRVYEEDVPLPADAGRGLGPTNEERGVDALSPRVRRCSEGRRPWEELCARGDGCGRGEGALVIVCMRNTGTHRTDGGYPRREVLGRAAGGRDGEEEATRTRLIRARGQREL